MVRAHEIVEQSEAVTFGMWVKDVSGSGRRRSLSVASAARRGQSVEIVAVYARE